MLIKKPSVRFGLLLTAASLTAAASFAAPPAGTKIGNQATATYVNGAGDTISVTSNKVETTVRQIGALTLEADNSEEVAPGGKVFLPHTVTNDGNGPDSYSLTATENAGDYNFTGLRIFPDANFDGIADSTTQITATPTLAAGEAFGFVIEATVPGGAGAGDEETITVTATSAFSQTAGNGPVQTKTNTDTVTITTGPVTEIVKSMTVVDNGDGVTGPGDTVNITLTYSSTGLAPADALVVTDVLDANLTYVPGSGRWSDIANTTALTDGEDPAGSVEPGSPAGFEQENGNGYQIAYSFNTDTVEFEIDRVPAGRTARVTFSATIDANTPAGEITNQATQTVNGVAFPPSNVAQVTVEPVYRVVAADAAALRYGADDNVAADLDAANASATDDDGTLNDVVEEDTDTFQGGSVTMEFVVTNSSNVTDTIDLTVSNGATPFPAGTTFQLVGADGATPVVDALGPLAPNAFQRVNIIATLPPNAPARAAGATNYEVLLTAQSTNGGPTNAVTGLFTGAVLAATVDLTNRDFVDPADEGAGPGGGVALLSQSTDPGDPVTFPLVVNNDGPVSDTYDIALAQPLPPGWQVEFQLADGTPVTNTGVIPSGGTLEIFAVITPPADATPVDQDVQISVTSPTSGQGDTITNTVSVNQIVDVAFEADQSTPIAPGGIADIPHTLTNLGNITITEGGITPAVDGFDTFTGTIFWDVNNDGQVDSGDVVIDNILDIAGGIAPGASIPLIHRVQVPSNGAVGVSETETLTLETSLNAADEAGAGTVTDADPTNNAVEDTVTVVSGDLTLVKQQGLDAGCDGGAVTFVTSGVQARPGECIRYRIVAENTGNADADAVTIRDTVPGFTTLTQCAANACAITVTPAGSTVTTQPAEGAGGALASSHGDLLPGGVASLEFTVKIDE